MTQLGEFQIEELSATPALIVVPLFAEEREERFYEAMQDRAETKAIRVKKLRTHHHEMIGSQ